MRIDVAVDTLIKSINICMFLKNFHKISYDDQHILNKSSLLNSIKNYVSMLKLLFFNNLNVVSKKKTEKM